MLAPSGRLTGRPAPPGCTPPCAWQHLPAARFTLTQYLSLCSHLAPVPLASHALCSPIFMVPAIPRPPLLLCRLPISGQVGPQTHPHQCISAPGASCTATNTYSLPVRETHTLTPHTPQRALQKAWAASCHCACRTQWDSPSSPLLHLLSPVACKSYRAFPNVEPAQLRRRPAPHFWAVRCTCALMPG
jgi:hypothetical protein